MSPAPTGDLLFDDEQNRRRALALESFIVEAPAGAGKTELLTQRYLRLLATVESPEEIIAITFTNKAAGEMRSRIQDSLALAQGGVAPTATHKLITFELARAALARSAELGWDLLKQTGRMRLTTIDALCSSLARQMPFLSRFGAQPATIEDASRHYADAARRALDHLEDDGEHAETVATALAYLDNDVTRLSGLLAQMLARREQWREIAELDNPELAIGDALHALVNLDLSRVADALDASWQARLMPLARFTSAILERDELADWTELLTAEIDDLPKWRAVAAMLLTQKNEPRKTVTVKNGFPAGKEFKPQKDAIIELLQDLSASQILTLQRIGQLPRVDHDNDLIVRAMARLMKLAAAELWLVFRERGEVDFGELSMRAIAALGDELDPSELGLRLDYHIKHLLVDEFQDTSPTQIDLLTRLTAGWQSGDGRTLFVVGDPMQSIYRFRKADVGLFLRVAQNGIGELTLEQLRLSRNNRSCPPVVDWINQTFPQVFPAADDPTRGEITYREFVATRETASDAGVTLHPVIVAKSAGRHAAARVEAEQIVQTIAAEWQADPSRKIAVLVSARNRLTELVSEIRTTHPDWHYSAVEIESLVQRQPVQDVISLTRALHHRGDRVHWLAILRAPWCGLVLADLHALAGDDHKSTIWSLMHDATRLARLSDDGQRRLGHLRIMLAEALTGQGRQSLRCWVEDVWKKLGGATCLEGANDRNDVDAFFNRLDQLDAAGRFAIDNLEADMEKLYAAPDAQADGRLELMTIHKAKGLEFDTVILPGLHRRSGSNEPPLLAWDSFALEDGEHLVAAPLNRRSVNAAEAPSAYDFLRRMESEREANESTRVLYVAVTRAVRHLHIFGVIETNDDGVLVTPQKATALGRLWPALESEFIAAMPTNAQASPIVQGQTDFYDAAGEGWPDDMPDQLSDELSCFVPAMVRLKTPYVTPDTWTAPPMANVSKERNITAANALAATIGTLAHACMEQMLRDARPWTATRIEGMHASLERWLICRGWRIEESTTAARRVIDMLKTTIASADGQWVLARHEDDAVELALSTTVLSDDEQLTGGVSTKVVDRSFVDNGTRWVIDYKTADLGSSADAASLRQHAEYYRQQLEQYAALFQADGLPVREAIFYLAHGKLVELE
ncbi:MAG: UvrD-helicase domain-containing protein [Rhodocyclaceae bacterium]|nr:UvrD-helicase domain-containing protein [Rhodocyclaceae bacterium]